jgi:hypothetical protein
VSNALVRKLLVAALSGLIAVLALEIVFRLAQGGLLRFESFTADRPRGPGLIAYDEQLGWTTAPSQHEQNPVYGVDPSGLRGNGLSTHPPGPPVLLVGDSFTFGDEVSDADTWAARLQDTLNRPVLNAGVPAYGIDQAVLRAERLLDQYRPTVVILSFISDDVSRTEFDYYPWGRGWKPYFAIVDDALQLRNTPVPTTTAPRPWPRLRHALGYSYLADAALRRTALRWWRGLPPSRRVHNDGERVSTELLVRLAGRVEKQGGRFFAVAFATNGRLGGNRRLSSAIAAFKARGLDVLDLSAEVLGVDSEKWPDLFMPNGHYSPAMNRRIAARIASYVGGSARTRDADPLPDPGHAVLLEHAIGGHQRDALDQRLRGEQAVEEIPVMKWHYRHLRQMRQAQR